MEGNAQKKFKDEASTTVYEGTDIVTAIRVQTLSRALKRLDVCKDAVGTVALVQFQPVRNALVSAAKDRNIHIRFITDIRQENLASCKELLDFVELRHLENVKGNFVVTENEYYAFAEIRESKIPLQAIYSKEKVIVEQQQYLFDTLWNSAIPAKMKIRQLEQGIAPVGMKIVVGMKEIERLAYDLINRSVNSHLYAAIDNREPENRESAIQYLKNLMNKNPKFELLLIADIQKETADYYKAIMKEGVHVRHVERNKVTFILSENEYLSGQPAAEERLDEGVTVPSEATWTNNPEVILQMNQVFQTMWKSALLGEARIRQLEEGVEPQETKLFDDLDEVFRLVAQLIEQVRFEVLIIAASDKMLLRNAEAFRNLVKIQKRIDGNIRILAPLMERSVFDIIPAAKWRKVDPSSVSVMILDRKWMFITQYADSLATTTQEAISSNIYSTNRQTILGMVSVFEALWRQSELRESEQNARTQLGNILTKEERSRKHAQLLQDILTHDIRNYNQVSRLSAELLSERLPNDPETQTLVDSLLQSIDGSTSLVERGRKLGRILAEENARLLPVNLIDSLRRSLTLVRQGIKDKVITEEIVPPEGFRRNEILVEADDLLDEVYSNVFSNSIKYTKGLDVQLGTKIEDCDKYWKISLSDKGVGISQKLLSKVFDRYLAGASGSGLGMSIIHALIVHRYNGRLELTSTQQVGSSGTRIDIWLKKTT